MAGFEGAFGWGGDGREGGPLRGSGGGGNGVVRRQRCGKLWWRAPAEDLLIRTQLRCPRVCPIFHGTKHFS